MAIDSEVDWDEVAELIAESYCIQAPKRLAAFVRDNREVVLEERSRLQDARARLKTRETDRLSDTTSARRADPTSVLDDYPEPLWESEQTPPDN